MSEVIPRDPLQFLLRFPMKLSEDLWFSGDFKGRLVHLKSLNIKSKNGR